MQRLRVALVAPSLRILGGQSVQADRLRRAWQEDAEVEAWIVPINPPFPQPLRFAASVRYLRTIINQLIYVPGLIRQLARADVVHVFSASYSSFLLAPLPAILIARALGRPVILNYRSGEAPDHLKRSPVARWALRHVALNIVPSRFLADVFARFGVDALVVPNVVDFDHFTFRDREPLRARLLSTRNFDPLYNVACTLRAFRLVQDRWPDASLTLVGAGREEPALRALARQLKLRNVVFAGSVGPDEIAGWYADHDIYIQSPDIDNMPTSVIEAYASGLPVVSTDAGGIPTILSHGEHGLLAAVNDHEGLARHVLALLDNPDAARRYARAGFQSCQTCTWTNARQQWLRAYRSVLAGAAASRSTAVPVSQAKPETRET
jgi:glycosyltransferase involved in cell wall biosynthesis